MQSNFLVAITYVQKYTSLPLGTQEYIMSDLQKAFDVYLKTQAALELAKSNYGKALNQLKTVAGQSTFQVIENGEEVFYQARSRDGNLYICKLNGKPKGRPKGSKNKPKAALIGHAEPILSEQVENTPDEADADGMVEVEY